MAQRIGGVGSVRGLTVMIATEGIFVWCAVTPTSACKHCQQYLGTVSNNTVDAPLQERVKSRKNRVVFITVIENPPKVDILQSRATYYRDLFTVKPVLFFVFGAFWCFFGAFIFQKRPQKGMGLFLGGLVETPIIPPVWY